MSKITINGGKLVVNGDKKVTVKPEEPKKIEKTQKSKKASK